MTDTITVKLSQPFSVAGKMLTEVTLRRPKVKDLRAMDRAKGDDNSEVMQGIVMAAVLCGLPVEAIDEMDAVDFASPIQQ
jgi:hypothetical protein